MSFNKISLGIGFLSQWGKKVWDGNRSLIKNEIILKGLNNFIEISINFSNDVSEQLDIVAELEDEMLDAFDSLLDGLELVAAVDL